MSDPQPAIRAMVFDIDDTLFPERDYVRSGYRAVCERLRRGLGCGGSTATAAIGPMEDWLWGRFLSGRTAGAFDALSERFRLGLSRGRIEELVEVYRNHRPDIRPYGEMPFLLGRLRESFLLGLLSDGYLPAQRHKLQALGLERFFDAMAFTRELGRDAWQPSPRGFEVMREKLGVPHEACAFVADNPAKDFVAANKLGWRTVQYLQPGQVHAANVPPDGGRPQFSARGPDELRSLLQPA